MRNAAADATTEPIGGLGEIADRYAGYIVDLWGVMHDGVNAFDAAVNCLRTLRKRGKRVVMLSNAPRRAALAADRSAAIGVTPDLYDRMITSGEDCWQFLEGAAPGSRALFIAAGKDKNFLDGLAVEPVDDPAIADFVLCLGVEGDVADLAVLEVPLREAQRRGLLLLCANPDLVVLHGGRLELCAGSVAQRYEALGGCVQYHGKPHAAVYRRAFGALGVEPARVLAIGDSLRTDVAGADSAGIDAVFVTDGIHLEELEDELGSDPDLAHVAAKLAQHDPAPRWAMRRLSW